MKHAKQNGSLLSLKTAKLCFVILLCFCGQIVQCQEFTQYFYSNGNVSSEGNLVDGKPDGYWRTYYDSGVLKSVGKRTNQQLDSVWCFYDSLGREQKQISYFENLKNGYYKEFAYTADSAKFLQKSVLYVNNLKQGLELTFDSAGTCVSKIPYVDGKREGKAYEFAHDSIISAIAFYENDNVIFYQAVNRVDSLGRKTGLHLSFFPSGTIKTEASYFEGKLSGAVKTYNQREQLVQTAVYENDTLLYANSATTADFDDPTERKEYYSDSSLKYKGSFRGEIRIGVHRHYSPQGAITHGELFDSQGTLLGSGITLENGDKSGEWTFFYPSGERESQGLFAENKKVGVWKFYYTNGVLKQNGQFLDGKFHGLWEFFNPAGELQKHEEYAHGERNGLCVEYDDEGVILSEGIYKDNRRQGFWTETIGELRSEGNYEYGDKIGAWKSVYVSGGKAFRGEYFAGEPHGKHVFFYKNGQIEHNEQWRHGKPVKAWNYYTEQGKLRYSVYYKAGRETHTVVPTK